MSVELHNTGDATIRREVQTIVEHVLSGRPREWRVSIVGSRAKEDSPRSCQGLCGRDLRYPSSTNKNGVSQPGAIDVQGEFDFVWDKDFPACPVILKQHDHLGFLCTEQILHNYCEGRQIHRMSA